MAEGARLESVYTLTGIGGSNPSLSAILIESRATLERLGESTEKAGVGSSTLSLATKSLTFSYLCLILNPIHRVDVSRIDDLRYS